MIQNTGETSVPKLAAAVHVSVIQAEKELQELIDKEEPADIYIDEQRKELIPPQAEIEETVWICKSCGAQNRVVKGKQGVCEYCGMPLE